MFGWLTKSKDETRDVMTTVEADGRWYDGFPITTARSGVRVDENLALGHVPVFAAVTLIAEAMGTLPLHVYERQEPYGKRRAREHPLSPLLSESPNEDMTAQSWVETMTIHAAIWGDAYSYIERDEAENVVEIIPLLPDRTRPTRNAAGLLIYETNVGGQTRYLRPDEVIHIKGPSLNGVQGIRRLLTLKDSVATSIAADRYAAEAFANGVHPSGTVTHPQGIGPVAARKLREDVERQHQGLGNKHKVIVLQEGAAFQPFQLDLEKSQLLDVRRFGVEEAGRMFRVPSILLNQTRDSNYSIGETLTRHFVTYTLQPWAMRFRQEIGRKALRESERSQFFVEFDFRGLLQGDHAARAAYYREMVNLGAMVPAEIREIENLNPYPDPELGTVPVLNGAYATLAAIEAGRVTPPGSPPIAGDDRDDEPQPPATEPFDDGHMISVADIARHTPGVARNTIAKRLERWRTSTGEGWTQDPEALPPAPRYAHRWGSVKHLFTGDITPAGE